MSLCAANSGPLSVVVFLHHACKTVAWGECYQSISNMGEASVCIRLISSDFWANIALSVVVSNTYVYQVESFRYLFNKDKKDIV